MYKYSLSHKQETSFIRENSNSMKILGITIESMIMVSSACLNLDTNSSLLFKWCELLRGSFYKTNLLKRTLYSNKTLLSVWSRVSYLISLGLNLFIYKSVITTPYPVAKYASSKWNPVYHLAQFNKLINGWVPSLLFIYFQISWSWRAS